MEEKIIAARITLKRIFRFINKVALSIECELFQDCINRLEIDAHIHKKRGVKMLHFLLIPFPQAAAKMMGRVAWKEFINLPNYLKI